MERRSFLSLIFTPVLLPFLPKKTDPRIFYATEAVVINEAKKEIVEWIPINIKVPNVDSQSSVRTVFWLGLDKDGKHVDSIPEDKDTITKMRELSTKDFIVHLKNYYRMM